MIMPKREEIGVENGTPWRVEEKEEKREKRGRAHRLDRVGWCKKEEGGGGRRRQVAAAAWPGREGRRGERERIERKEGEEREGDGWSTRKRRGKGRKKKEER